MRELGIEVDRDLIYPDLAFALPTPGIPATAQAEAGGLSVGLGVMAYHGWRKHADNREETYRAYIDKLAQFAVWLIDEGHRATVLLGETNDARARDDLVAAVLAIRPQVPAGSLATPAIASFADAMREIGKTDLIVATRFHNVVAALKMRRPVVSIGYSAKNDALLAEVGLEAYCQHIDTFDVPTLIAHFREVATHRLELAEKIGRIVTGFETDLTRQDAMIAAGLEALARH